MAQSKNNANSNTRKLDAILERLNNTDTEINRKFEEIDKKFNAIFTELKNINGKLDNITKEFNGYTKREQDIFEVQCCDTYIKHISGNKELFGQTAVSIPYKQIRLKDLYSRTSRERVTDLDGAIIENYYSRDMLKSNATYVRDMVQKKLANPRLIQTAYEKNKPKLVLIEAKHGLTKDNIDDKLCNMQAIYRCFYDGIDCKNNENLLNSANADFVFQYGLEDYQDAITVLEKYNKDVKWYFASNAWTQTLENYVKHIYMGTLDFDAFATITIDNWKDFKSDAITTINRKKNQILSQYEKHIQRLLVCPIVGIVSRFDPNKPDEVRFVCEWFYNNDVRVQPTSSNNRVVVGKIENFNRYLQDFKEIMKELWEELRKYFVFEPILANLKDNIGIIRNDLVHEFGSKEDCPPSV